jgi:hypothetical protein
MIHGLPFRLGKIIHLQIVEGFAHTKFYALWVSLTLITFLRNMLFGMESYVSKGAGPEAHPAPHASVLTNDHGMGQRIALEGSAGTDIQAGRDFALDAGQSNHKPFGRIEVDPDIRILPLELSALRESAGQFAVPASHAAIEVNGHKFHGSPPKAPLKWINPERFRFRLPGYDLQQTASSD